MGMPYNPDDPHNPGNVMPAYENRMQCASTKYREGTGEEATAIEEDFVGPIQNGSIGRATRATEVQTATAARHPLAYLAGKYDDEPLWDDFMQAVREYRQEQNEREDAAE